MTHVHHWLWSPRKQDMAMSSADRRPPSRFQVTVSIISAYVKHVILRHVWCGCLSLHWVASDAFKWRRSKIILLQQLRRIQLKYSTALSWNLRPFFPPIIWFNSGWKPEQTSMIHTSAQTRMWAPVPPAGDKETLRCHFGFLLPTTPLQQPLGWAGVIGATYDPVKSGGR